MAVGKDGSSPLPGGGPWRISEYCPARQHNTLTYARGSRSRHAGPKCVCPRAMSLLLQYRHTHDSSAKSRERKRSLNQRHVRLPGVSPLPVSATQPDFRHGVCTTERGKLAARQGMNDQASRAGIAARQRAKNLCNVGPCPLRDRCRAWVLSQEKPAGSWGGVWGGLDPWNRRHTQLIIKDGKAKLIPYDID